MWSNDRKIHVIVKYDKDYEEYSCKWYCNGVYSEEKTYYTDDRTDAYDTARAMIFKYNLKGIDHESK